MSSEEALQERIRREIRDDLTITHQERYDRLREADAHVFGPLGWRFQQDITQDTPQ